MIKTCSICLYGDGKWEGRTGTPLDSNLPICEKCKADGWLAGEKMKEEIKKDLLLSKVIHDKEHITDMPYCWCKPKVEVMENGNMLIVHNK